MKFETQKPPKAVWCKFGAKGANLEGNGPLVGGT